MAKKFYAVRKGRKEGIYTSWDECRAQVHGFSGPEYKSFLTLEEAQKFMEGGSAGKEQSDDADVLRAYVDGSYIHEKKLFSYGMVILEGEKELTFCESFDDEQLALLRNVAGEIKGAQAAMAYALEHNKKKLIIYHDYEGIAKWCNGQWRARLDATKAYRDFYLRAAESVEISFCKVAGHTGDYYNEYADRLAKQALGLADASEFAAAGEKSRPTDEGVQPSSKLNPMTYRQAMDYLDAVRSKKGMVLGLDNMRELMRRLGNPQDKVSFVQIAGTNGKGSTAAFLSEILKEDGRRVGRYTSPAVFSFEEQLQADNECITREEAARGISLVAQAAKGMENAPTAFEQETALAFWFFAEKGCDIAIIEAGLGGDEDATNIVTTTVCSILTSISIDHRRILGDTVAKIAAHKAGIIKPGTKVVSLKQDDAAMQVIKKRCEEQNAELIAVNPEDARLVSVTRQEQILFYKDLEAVKMHQRGLYQKDNAAIAIEAARALKVTDAAIRRGIEKTVWRGRFEQIASSPDIVLDGAHNIDGIKKLRASVDFYYGAQPVTYIMGVLADKDYEEEISILLGRAARVYTVTPDSPRACGAGDLKKAIKDRYAQLKVTAARSVESALKAALSDGDPIIVCGTLTILRRAAEWTEKTNGETL